MNFFFDGSLPKRLVHAVRSLELPAVAATVVYKHEKFPPSTLDTDWIAALATEKDWAIVSLDTEILRKPIERAAWDEAGLTGFFLDGTWGNLKLDELAWRFLRWWPRLKVQTDLAAAGSTFIVPREVGRGLIPLRASQLPPAKRKPRPKKSKAKAGPS